MKEEIYSALDLHYMDEALKLAKKGIYTTLPNPAVGCVLVKDKEIIGRGFHHKAGLPHAEVCAMRDAAAHGYADLSGVTAYVTLEPCSHYGLTPPCALALVKAKVARVVCAMVDPNPKVSGKGIKILTDAGIDVLCGIRYQEAYNLNEAFFYAMEHSHPFVTVKYGISLDAKTALKTGESKWITGKEARQDVQRLRALNQAVLTTAETVEQDNPGIDFRRSELTPEILAEIPAELSPVPYKIVLDPRNKLSLKEKIFTTQGKTILVRLSKDNEIIKEQVNDNLEIWQLPKDVNNSLHIDLDLLLTELNGLRIRSLLVEAGSRFGRELFNKKLVNKLVVYIAPKILGNDSRSAFDFEGPKVLAEAKQLKLENFAKIGNDLRLTYSMD